MNLTSNCRCNYRQYTSSEPFPYQGFGTVSIEDQLSLSHSVKEGRVVKKVSSIQPIMVDCCVGKDCIVEMDLSSRFVVVGDEWRQRKYRPALKKLIEKRIYPLGEIQRFGLEGIKWKIYKSYYSDDGIMLKNQNFTGNLSPAIMAEAGMIFIGDDNTDSVACFFCDYTTSHTFKDWDHQLSPEERHLRDYRLTLCIERRKYHFPVLTDESGADITGKTYRMVLGGSVAGHPKGECSRAILVTRKGYQLPMLDSHEFQKELNLVNIHLLKRSLRKKIKGGYTHTSGFERQMERVIQMQSEVLKSPFNKLYSELERNFNRLISSLNQFQADLTDTPSGAEIDKINKGMIPRLQTTQLKKESDTIVHIITSYEETIIYADKPSRVTHDEANISVNDKLQTIGRDLTHLNKAYSNRYFLDEFFNKAMVFGDIGSLFLDYEECDFVRTEKTDQVFRELITVRSDLLSKLSAISVKMHELLTIYMDVFKQQGSAVTGSKASKQITHESPLFC